jgi:hypothetical protein
VFSLLVLIVVALLGLIVPTRPSPHLFRYGFKMAAMIGDIAMFRADLLFGVEFNHDGKPKAHTCSEPPQSCWF